MSETKANLRTQSRTNRIVSVYSWSCKISKLRDRVVFIWKLLGRLYVMLSIFRARHGRERFVPQGKLFSFLRYVMKIPFIRKYLLTTIAGYDTIFCSLLSTYTVFLVDPFPIVCKFIRYFPDLSLYTLPLTLWTSKLYGRWVLYRLNISEWLPIHV